MNEKNKTEKTFGDLFSNINNEKEQKKENPKILNDINENKNLETDSLTMTSLFNNSKTKPTLEENDTEIKSLNEVLKPSLNIFEKPILKVTNQNNLENKDILESNNELDIKPSLEKKETDDNSIFDSIPKQELNINNGINIFDKKTETNAQPISEQNTSIFDNSNKNQKEINSYPKIELDENNDKEENDKEENKKIEINNSQNIFLDNNEKEPLTTKSNQKSQEIETFDKNPFLDEKEQISSSSFFEEKTKTTSTSPFLEESTQNTSNPLPEEKETISFNPLFESPKQEQQSNSFLEEKEQISSSPFFEEENKTTSFSPFFAENQKQEQQLNPFFDNKINLDETKTHNIVEKSNKIDTSNAKKFDVKIVKKKESPIKFIIGVISYAIFILLLFIGITLLVYIADIKIRAAKGDYTPPKYNAYVVLTGSMLPQIQVYDVVITKKIEPQKLKKDDVITFASSDTRFLNTIITHRIIKKNFDAKTNTYTFQTKGDNNNVADSALVEQNKIFGKVILKVPKLGYLQHFLAQDGGYILVVIVPCLIVISYDIVKLIKGLKRKKYKNIKVQK